MKKLIKKPSIILAVILIFTVSDCGISSKFARAFYHDEQNPCSNGIYQNNEDCETWKTNHPHEYLKYKERMKAK